jgi:hypothetical protein
MCPQAYECRAGPGTGHTETVLEMRETCERCSSPLAMTSDDAFVCSYECTFCRGCADEMNATCPNCSGVLRQRPRRDN